MYGRSYKVTELLATSLVLLKTMERKWHSFLPIVFGCFNEIVNFRVNQLEYAFLRRLFITSELLRSIEYYTTTNRTGGTRGHQ